MPLGKTIITNACIVTMDQTLGVLHEADVLIDGEWITAVGPGLDPGDAQRIDASGMIVIPGLVDTHRHMWQGVLRGCGPDHTLADYFSEVLVRVGPQLSVEELYLGNLLSALGALDAGVTTVQDVSNVNDAPERSNALVAALRDSGLRAVFAYGHGAGPVPGRPRHGGLSRDAVRVRSELLADDDGLLTMALCVDANDDVAIRWNWNLARELDVPVALHCRGQPAPRPVSRLRKLGVLRPSAVFIHGTGLDAEQLRIIRDEGAALSIAPAVEMMMGHGFPPLAPALAAGLRPSISVDVETATASDMFIQMRAGLQAARYDSQHGPARGPLLTAREVLELATLAGAQALGMGAKLGAVAPGRLADLVLLRTDRPGLRPIYDAASAVVSSMDRGDVDTVLVGGRVVKRAGRLLRTDLADVLARADQVRARLVEHRLVRG